MKELPRRKASPSERQSLGGGTPRRQEKRGSPLGGSTVQGDDAAASQMEIRRRRLAMQPSQRGAALCAGAPEDSSLSAGGSPIRKAIINMQIGRPDQSIRRSWRQPTSRMEAVWYVFLCAEQLAFTVRSRHNILIIVVMRLKTYSNEYGNESLISLLVRVTVINVVISF